MTANAHEFEEIVAAFEQAWTTGRPVIQDFLAERSIPAESARAALLVELIAVDIEFRWKREGTDTTSAKATVEDYRADLATLLSAAAIPSELIVEEYRVRHRWGDAPSHEGYFRRFPERQMELTAELCRIDTEIAREKPRRQSSGFQIGMPEVSKTDDRPRLSYCDFLLHEMIGAGYSGRVFRATDRSTGRAVAVKFLRKRFQTDARAVERFVREADRVSELRHQGIVRIEGLGRTPPGGYFIVMELLAGPDLEEVSRQGVSIQALAGWMIEAAEAIDYAHRSGVVHCDLKPANIVLDVDGHARITDFGLAHWLDDNSNRRENIAGTAPYMAPEQVSAWYGGIGPHTDTYALGAVCYRLVTGQPPFSGNTLPDVLAQVVAAGGPIEAHVVRPGISMELSNLIGRAMSRQIVARFPSASSFCEALRDLGNK